MFGFPKALHSDNGEEFRNKNMTENSLYREQHQFVHGALSPQDKVEQINNTANLNIRDVFKEKCLRSTKWCEVVYA